MDYHWERAVVDDLTGESFGYCSTGEENFSLFFSLVIVVALIPVILVLIMAWKTKDVEDSFSESWWIFALVVVQAQVRETLMLLLEALLL